MTDEQPTVDKARKERSPSFPFISLRKAVERAQEMADAHKRSPARLSVVGETWGYGAKSSGLLQTVAALKAFGLIEDIGGGADRRIQVSDLGWRILSDARPGAKEQAIRDAALKPRLIAEYAPHWVPERPSDAHCISELHLDRGFTQDAAKLFLRVFDETVSYANLAESDNLSPSFQQENSVGVTIEVPTAQMRATTVAPSVNAEPFKISFGPGRITGTFDLSEQGHADKFIEVLNAMKVFLNKDEKNEEAAN
ncbi:hypothetical protein [Bradyrhizobium liaoningense]